MSCYYNKKGFTLIEIIVVIAISSILITAIFSVLSFAQRGLSMSEKRFQTQSGVRIPLEYLSKQLRNASSLSIITIEQAKQDLLNNKANDYIFIENGKIHHYKYNSGTYTELILSEGLTENNIFSKAGDDVLSISLSSQAYQSTTNIKMINFSLTSPVTIIQGEITDKAIKFSRVNN
ncbi:prepilin-type N-terminal cleavage/methylation domain-containing protein [Clostridium estertheticum]|uniref:Prepilin-type N-terminal cleavage/methylation domain-containing protein n=1 Tax=Clostridium estertheticum subsp. estertheticum TaxID=1552 RepID=A0A1J0GJG1_9CLOT|nr:prepilin-type N-terminal cleavage/methylation domain-containing protein [Clostridium estertheticum]APC41493.1 hypothetical protein A7L45_16110 [Clostridium estertheticum subsp. estertheticum]MBZ9616598.1 prepilin-type N-terminal cleavage/methylation domain-containing protein [Clostridium estertheticum subsp. laramiense]WAG72321.1 prepilin-type N-terminal cleavage/methylation domain-containing protein [Clostridium estertheticum]